MTELIAWGEATLLASSALMLLVLAVRAPVRRSLGPRLGYVLWALPAVRMVLPPLPAGALGALPVARDVTAGMSVLFAGPQAASGAWDEPHASPIGRALLALWLAGAVGFFALYAVRHLVFCRRLRAEGTELGRVGGIRVVAADVEGPLAFGVFRRIVAIRLAYELRVGGFTESGQLRPSMIVDGGYSHGRRARGDIHGVAALSQFI